MKPLRMLGFATVILCAVFASAQSPWTPVNDVPNIEAGAMALLTDGRVLVHDESGNPGTWGNWWTLTPSSHGDYSKGTWTQVATMPADYGPLYFASAVLPDGRYSSRAANTTSVTPFGPNWELFIDPRQPSNRPWTAVNPPSGWSNIGDAAATRD